ncbi:NTP transferase domain-containing protein [Motilibacter sp. K478]|nr:NTP transferase domain-containing protein [Motilibacter aurantiacus]NHC46377.1 NTP transferase domain-containing protein [Motilibacter aurantiacus]
MAVIQARAGSTRLPGKVLEPLGGRPVLGWVVRAAQLAGVFTKVVVATSTDPRDDAVADLALELGAEVVRGPEEDVLSRFLLVLDHHPAAALARLTADCPLLDPALIRLAVRTFAAAEGGLDYLSTVLERSLPHGLDVEVLSAQTLRRVGATATGVHRVHVTSAVYTSFEDYRVAGLGFLPHAADLRVTLDTPDDLRMLRATVAEIGDRAPEWRELTRLLRSRPDIVALNGHVVQKELSEG